MNKKNKNFKKVEINFFVAIITIIAIFAFVIFVWIVKNTKNYKVEAISSDIKEDSKNTNIIQVEIEEKTGEEENQTDLIDKQTYYIKVNYTANVVTIYKKDKKGEYTPYKAMICSTGNATPTSGIYEMKGKYRWLSLFGGVYGQYCSRITGHILFHSVPYLNQSPDSLEYWEYDKLGTTASAGCIRLTVNNAKWIYSNCPDGTRVEFYSSSDPGPLGKPLIQQISSNEAYRNWDPTDTADGNPWNGNGQAE